MALDGWAMPQRVAADDRAVKSSGRSAACAAAIRAEEVGIQ